MASGCARTQQPTCDPALLDDIRVHHLRQAEVTVCGAVIDAGRLRRSRSGLHRDFIVATTAGVRLRIDANLDLLGELPVRPGETAVVRGEYYDDADGREGLHWTHRTVHGTHAPGFVELDGVTYR